jgi:hypothetical protein
MNIEFTDRERAAFAKHELEQRRHEASLTFDQRLDMLAQLQEIAALFGHDRPPSWAIALMAAAPPAPRPTASP